MSIKIPYVRKETSSTLLVLSAAIALLLLASPLVLSNLLLQPVQATSIGSSSSSPGDISFRTPTPAKGNMFSPYDATLTFDAQGTNIETPQRLDTKGTYLITSKEEGTLYNGSIVYVQGCCLTNNSMGESIHLFANLPTVAGISILTSCSTSATNHIGVFSGGNYIGVFQGAVECSPQGGNSTTHSSSSPMTGTTTTQDRDSSNRSSSSSDSNSNRDGDRDGIPDSSDKCLHTSNPRCFKEGEASTTTQQQSSSTSSSGNQTR